MMTMNNIILCYSIAGILMMPIAEMTEKQNENKFQYSIPISDHYHCELGSIDPAKAAVEISLSGAATFAFKNTVDSTPPKR